MDITYKCTYPGQSMITAEISFLGKYPNANTNHNHNLTTTITLTIT